MGMKQTRRFWWPLWVVLALVGGWLIYQALPTEEPVRPTQEVSTPVADSLAGTGFYRMVRLLELDSLQHAAFRRAEVNYRQELANLRTSLQEVDRAIIQELAQAVPDTLVLQGYAQASGRLQQTLKQRTIDHFLQLHELCSPQQQEQLAEIFSSFEQGPPGRGRGQGQGRHGGRGWGRRP